MTEDLFRTWDGPYVLGSLSPADRLAFEAHLGGCDACMCRVAELRRAVSLLDLAPRDAWASREPSPDEVPTQTGFADLVDDAVAVRPHRHDEPDLPADLLPSLLMHVRRDRPALWRRRGTLLGVAAACVVALAVTFSVALTRHSSTVGPAPVASIANATLSATLSIDSHDSWDQVKLSCTYNSPTFIAGNYTAVAKDSAGRTEVVGSWPTIPGQTATISTPTTFHTGKITSVSILDASGRILAQLPA